MVDGSFSWAALIPLVVSVALAVWVLVECHRARMVRALVVAIVGAIFIFAPAAQWVLPGVDGLWVARSVGRIVEAQAKRPHPVVAASGYHEPSLVFILGGETRLIGPGAIAAAMKRDASVLALIGADKEKAFRAALAGDAARLVALGTARGFNYSKGDRVVLTLYRLAPNRLVPRGAKAD